MRNYRRKSGAKAHGKWNNKYDEALRAGLQSLREVPCPLRTRQRMECVRFSAAFSMSSQYSKLP